MKVFRFAFIILFFAILTTLLINSCSDNSPSGPDTNPDVVSKEIGPDGGEIASADGILTLLFPEGALNSTENITITPLNNSELGDEFSLIIDSLGVENAYELGPDGLKFDQPVVATVPSSQNAMLNDSTIQLSINRLMLTSSGGQVEGLDSLRVEPVDGGSEEVQLSGELSHFSTFTITDTDSTGFLTAIISGIPEQLQKDEDVELEVRSVVSLVKVAEKIPRVRFFKKADDAFIVSPEDGPIKILEEVPNTNLQIYSTTTLFTCRIVGSNPVRAAIGTEVFLPDFIESDVIIKALAVIFNIKIDDDISTITPVTTAPVQCIEATHTLAVQKDGAGDGTVTSDPPGINFGNDNTEEYEKDTKVTLTADPVENSNFAGWSGDIEGQGDDCQQFPPEGGTCTVTMDEDRTIKASFTPTSQIMVDLKAKIVNAPESVKPGETHSIEVHVSNHGTEDAVNAGGVFNISNGELTGTPDSDKANCDNPPTSEIGCSFHNGIPAGDILELIFEFKAGNPGILSFEAEVSAAGENEETEDDNTDETDIPVED